MDSNEIKRHAILFNRSRNNLLIVVAFTTINLFLFISGSEFWLLFSAIIPRLILDATVFSPDEAVWLVGIILAFGVAFLYCLCWLMAKRQRAWILVALILFSIDATAYLFLQAAFIMAGMLEVLAIVVIAIYAWIMYYLITGTIAWSKLRHATPQGIDAALREEAATSASFEAQKALKNLKPDENKDEDEN